jgi:folate-binding protein YgfZ
VGVRGPDAADYLQRMVSNDVEALEPGESCDALLLTPKARVIAPLHVLRRGDADFLLLTEPELAETVRRQLYRMRFAASVEVEVEKHRSHVLLGGDGPPADTAKVAIADYGEPGWEVLDALEPADAARLTADDLELLRIQSGTPRFGREIDERVLPAEAGLVERAVSFTKGCYPGQEPIARLHYRGHANRGLRVLIVDADELPAYDAELTLEGKVVGRVTSATRGRAGEIVALAYVRRGVPDDALLELDGGRTARPAEVMRPA